MNPIKSSIALILAMVVLAGCAAATADQPTAACPTSAPLSCPTASAQVMPKLDTWVSHYREYTNLRITFDPGDKCSMDILHPPPKGVLSYEIIVNDQTYEHYVVSAVTLNEGKTLKDLEDASKAVKGIVSPPSFSQLRTIDAVSPRSWTIHFVDMPESPIYLVCIVEGPVEQQVIEAFGPVEISQ